MVFFFLLLLFFNIKKNKKIYIYIHRKYCVVSICHILKINLPVAESKPEREFVENTISFPPSFPFPLSPLLFLSFSSPFPLLSFSLNAHIFAQSNSLDI